MRTLIAVAVAVIVGGAVMLSLQVEHEPTSWERCGVTWEHYLSDPDLRTSCEETP